MLYGYIQGNTLFSKKLQLDALKKRGMKIIFIEPVGNKIVSEQFDELLGKLEKGDTLVFYSIKVLPLTTLKMVKVFAGFNDRDISFESITEDLASKELFNILDDHNNYTRNVRSYAGLLSARARGRKGGRKPGLSEEALQKAQAAALLYKRGMPIGKILSNLGIGSKATLYRYLKMMGIDIQGPQKVS